MPSVKIDRPVEATLWVHTSNGEQWEATETDIKKFDLRYRTALYTRAEDMLLEMLEIEDFRDHPLAQALRYLIECAICYDHTPWSRGDGTPWPDDEIGGWLADEQLLRSAILGAEHADT